MFWTLDYLSPTRAVLVPAAAAGPHRHLAAATLQILTEMLGHQPPAGDNEDPSSPISSHLHSFL